jgi:hypothetical protein
VILAINKSLDARNLVKTDVAVCWDSNLEIWRSSCTISVIANGLAPAAKHAGKDVSDTVPDWRHRFGRHDQAGAKIGCLFR